MNTAADHVAHYLENIRDIRNGDREFTTFLEKHEKLVELLNGRYWAAAVDYLVEVRNTDPYAGSRSKRQMQRTSDSEVAERVLKNIREIYANRELEIRIADALVCTL